MKKGSKVQTTVEILKLKGLPNGQVSDVPTVIEVFGRRYVLEDRR